MYTYLYIHTVINTTILKLVAIYTIQLHVSAPYVGHHQFVHRTFQVTIQCVCGNLGGGGTRFRLTSQIVGLVADVNTS